MSSKEPKRLKDGKAFHKAMQADWLLTAQGHVAKERTIKRKSGRKGRVDLLIDEEEDMVTVVEYRTPIGTACEPIGFAPMPSGIPGRFGHTSRQKWILGARMYARV